MRLEHPRTRRATSKQTYLSGKPSRRPPQSDHTDHWADGDDSPGKVTIQEGAGSMTASSFNDIRPIYNTALPNRCKQRQQGKRSARMFASDTDIERQSIHHVFRKSHRKNTFVESANHVTDRLSGIQYDHLIFKESPVSSENEKLHGDLASRDRRKFKVTFFKPVHTISQHDVGPDVVGKAISMHLESSDEDVNTDDERNLNTNKKIWEMSTFSLMTIFIVLRLAYETWFGENYDFLLGNAFLEGDSTLFGFVDNGSYPMP